jgi:hypothetical protein
VEITGIDDVKRYGIQRWNCESDALQVVERYLEMINDQGASDEDLRDRVNGGAHVEEEKDYCRILQPAIWRPSEGSSALENTSVFHHIICIDTQHLLS